MSNELIIDTTSGIQTEVQIEPLALYDENHSMLSIPIPEYDVSKLPTKFMSNLVKRLKLTMRMYSGLGLSANQCGVFERVFVIGGDDNAWACINPKVLSASPNIVKEGEGCLSFPALVLKVDRPEWIVVEYYTEAGERIETKMEGLTARCFLHELDHMNGVKFTAHAKPLALQMAREKAKKIIKKIKRVTR
jgi:peptide deformylase